MIDMKAEMEKRYERLREEMTAQGVEVLVLYSAAWKTEIVHYAANYRPFGGCSCVLLPLAAEPVLFVSGEGEYPRAKGLSCIADVRVIAGYDMQPVAQAAHQLGRTAAIAGRELLSRSQHAAFVECFGEEHIRSGWPILDKVARIKSPAEIEMLRSCAKIADVGLRAMVDSVRAGIREYELAANINAAMLAAGAEDNFQMTSIGQNLTCIHVPGEHALQSGDHVLAEITPFQGSITYSVQHCATVKAGKASAPEKSSFDLLTEALERSLDIIKPGVQAKEVALLQNKIIGSRGYEKYCNPPYMRLRGHNLGLGTIELTVDNEMPLQPGMCFMVHPNQFIPEVGYLVCGAHILVTETGIERLSSLPVKLYEVEVAGI